jgi:hypothetical protein
MDKKSKLTEKAARLPELREQNWGKLVPEYLQSVKSQVSEPAKSLRFAFLLKDLFGIEPGFIEEYISGIEKYIKVKQKDRILRGKVDDLFGNLVVEFERDLNKKQEEAEDQLKKYVACLWSQEPSSQRTPYICLATDGASFAVYSPFIAEALEGDIQSEDVNLKPIEQLDWSLLSPHEIYFWLDRYFLRKEILSPRSEDIIKDFGVKSHAFQVTSETLLFLWRDLKEEPDYKVVYESWEKYLRIVYGSEVAEEELFCRHTYLATLAKLMAWSRLTEGKIDNDQITSVLSGQFFKEQGGIENFLEEDFFSWIVRENAKDTGLECSRMLLSLLKNYNLRELSEDVLKSLYQELVDPKTRHDLGEFYTPDWLAHRMVHKLFEIDTKSSLPDPSCGSGTFLYLAIREKRDRLPKTHETLDHILKSVYGVDIHPLAVIVAKTNYILALGDLVKKRKGRITIPIYLSDTIRPPERERAKDVKIPVWFESNIYRVKIDEKEVYFSEAIIQSPNLYDDAIECAKAFATQNAGDKIEKSAFDEFIRIQYPDLPQDEDTHQSLFYTAKVLKDFIEHKRDTIWAFILKNIYKPLFLKGKFDYVVGNPPWLSFRYAEPSYQSFLRDQITKYYCLLSGRGELITHLELGTLFFLRAADLYLRERGTIAFVLPRSIFTADQHDGLRKGTFKEVGLTFKEVWDLEGVNPLFNVPSCFLVAQKERTEIFYPISGLRINGKLDRRNASIDEAEKNLTVQDVEFYLHKRGTRSFWSIEKGKSEEKESFYKKYFFEGATIVPRSLWFVEVKSSPLGFDPSFPPVESSERAKKEAKDAYKGLVMRGNIENQFLYATLLSTDLLPFGHRDYRFVILPIEPSENGYRLVNVEEARRRGFLNLTRWLEKAQEEWERRRGTKAKKMSIYERLDRYRGLTKQNPETKYLVLYPMSATYLCACVVKNQPMVSDIEGQKIAISGIISDYKSLCAEAKNLKEAFYLASFLNSTVVDRLIKPMQTRGQWGPRDICKKVLEFPIPQFDPSNRDHLNLAELGKGCSTKVSKWVESRAFGKIKSVGVLRGKVREMLRQELKEIDSIVKSVI